MTNVIPFVNITIATIVAIDLAKSFGKDTLYRVGLAILGFIFVPILGLGKATCPS